MVFVFTRRFIVMYMFMTLNVSAPIEIIAIKNESKRLQDC